MLQPASILYTTYDRPYDKRPPRLHLILGGRYVSELITVMLLYILYAAINIVTIIV